MTYEGEEMREIKPRHLAVKLNISETHVRHLLRMGSWHHPAGTAYAWDEGEEEREVLAYFARDARALAQVLPAGR
jgi:hypothetical protein